MVPFEGGCADGHLLPVNPMQATGKLPGRVFVEHSGLGDTMYEGSRERGAYVALHTYYPKSEQHRFTPPPGVEDFYRRRRR
jgi:hypothetical protein